MPQNSNEIIDLRSDTVTRPGPEMRRAIAEAEVGDDVHGDDPTVNALEARVAKMFGKEAALYVPSGSMGNFVAIDSLVQPGDEVILERDCHVFYYEVASVAAMSGVQINALDGDRGVMTAAQIAPHIRKANLHSPGTRVIAIENTHNRAGGHIYPIDEMKRIRELADERGVAVHLDGARLANAHVATGISFRDYGALCDTASICFSKGLGAPVGSIVVSTAAVIARARRKRKQLGGGMRQAGILAAAALYALDHHVERMSEDHNNARRLAGYIERAEGLTMAFGVDTNIVVFDVDPAAFTVKELLAQLKSRGVLAGSTGPGRIRMITHLDVSTGDIDRAGEILCSLERR